MTHISICNNTLARFLLTIVVLTIHIVQFVYGVILYYLCHTLCFNVFQYFVGRVLTQFYSIHFINYGVLFILYFIYLIISFI